jgi:hypothetical protein
MKFLPALLAALALALAPTAHAGQRTTEQKEAARYAGVVGALLKTARSDLIELSKLESIEGGEENATACNDETNALAKPERYTVLGVADAEGDLYCVNPRPTTVVAISDRAYFLRALGTRGFGVGDYQVGRQTGIQAIGLGYAVWDDTDIAHVVIAPLALTFLDEHLTGKFNARKADDLLVIDDHGTELARVGNRTGHTGRNHGGTQLVKAMLRRDRGKGRYAGRNYAWTTVPGSDGAIHVAVGVPR